ncbi:MAG: hypothetical protein AAFY26_26425, partial [Cyanobacteria bacterium J06638_22]
ISGVGGAAAVKLPEVGELVDVKGAADDINSPQRVTAEPVDKDPVASVATPSEEGVDGQSAFSKMDELLIAGMDIIRALQKEMHEFREEERREFLKLVQRRDGRFAERQSSIGKEVSAPIKVRGDVKMVELQKAIGTEMDVQELENPVGSWKEDLEDPGAEAEPLPVVDGPDREYVSPSEKGSGEHEAIASSAASGMDTVGKGPTVTDACPDTGNTETSCSDEMSRINLLSGANHHETRSTEMLPRTTVIDPPAVSVPDLIPLPDIAKDQSQDPSAEINAGLLKLQALISMHSPQPEIPNDEGPFLEENGEAGANDSSPQGGNRRTTDLQPDQNVVSRASFVDTMDTYSPSDSQGGIPSCELPSNMDSRGKDAGMKTAGDARTTGKGQGITSRNWILGMRTTGEQSWRRGRFADDNNDQTTMCIVLAPNNGKDPIKSSGFRSKAGLQDKSPINKCCKYATKYFPDACSAKEWTEDSRNQVGFELNGKAAGEQACDVGRSTYSYSRYGQDASNLLAPNKCSLKNSSAGVKNHIQQASFANLSNGGRK